MFLRWVFLSTSFSSKSFKFWIFKFILWIFAFFLKWAVLLSFFFQNILNSFHDFLLSFWDEQFFQLFSSNYLYFEYLNSLYDFLPSFKDEQLFQLFFSKIFQILIFQIRFMSFCLLSKMSSSLFFLILRVKKRILFIHFWLLSR